MMEALRVLSADAAHSVLHRVNSTLIDSNNVIRFTNWNMAASGNLISEAVFGVQVLKRLIINSDGPYDFPEIFRIFLSPTGEPIVWVPGDIGLVENRFVETVIHHSTGGVNIEMNLPVPWNPFYVKFSWDAAGSPQSSMTAGLNFGREEGREVQNGRLDFKRHKWEKRPFPRKGWRRPPRETFAPRADWPVVIPDAQVEERWKRERCNW